MGASTLQGSDAVKERPVLLSGEFVRAILDGRKTQTRRPMFRGGDPRGHMPWKCRRHWQDGDDVIRCPFGEPGEGLWVRETFFESGYTYRAFDEDDEFRGWSGFGRYNRSNLFFAADGRPEVRGENAWSIPIGPRHRRDTFIPDQDNRFWRIRPSIHMPRWASRIDLEVVDVRAERLNAITSDDVIAEGVERASPHMCVVESFAKAWDSIYGRLRPEPPEEWHGHPWDVNEWVWVCEFKVLEIKSGMEPATVGVTR